MSESTDSHKSESYSSKETLQEQAGEGICESPKSNHEDNETSCSKQQTGILLSKNHEKAARSASVTITDLDRCQLQRNSTNIRVDCTSNLSSTGKTKERLERPQIPEMKISENIVGWDGQMDPHMPLNFPEGLKWCILALTSAITLMVAFASSMIAPGISFVSTEFNNTSSLIETWAVTIFLLGFAVGPVLLSPLSEIYGRKSVLTCGNVFFLLWVIAAALAPNMPALITFRFLGGMGGSASFTIGGGLISDLFDIDMRGTASSMYALGTLFGPVIGPVCGGFIAEYIGWRWNFWVLAIPSGLLTLAIMIFTKETNHQVLIRWKVESLRKEFSNPNLRSCYDDQDTGLMSSSQLLAMGITRPLKLLFYSPIIFILATYSAFVYGMQYLFSTTVPSVFEVTYNWNREYTGLAYLGLGLGFLIGAMTVARINDATVIRLTKANKGVFEPEMRLPACIFFACFIPVTFFWYGWSAFYKVHWLVPIMGLVPFGIGQIGVFIPIQTYVIDSFPSLAASGIAALTIMRSLLGAVLPLAGPSMYDSLGLGWGNSVFGFIAIILVPFPLLIYKYGGRVRKRYPVNV